MGVISAEDRNKLTNHLEKKWRDNDCPVCHTTQWIIPFGDWSIEGGVSQGTATLPVVPLSCENCGFIVLFNSIICGIDSNKNKKDNAQSIHIISQYKN